MAMGAPIDAAPGDGGETTFVFKSQQYAKQDYVPSTRMGKFDVAYLPGRETLQISVRCRFAFITGRRMIVLPHPTDPQNKPGTMAWADVEPMTNEEEARWKRIFLQQTSECWSLKHLFLCRKKGLESLRAIPIVRFVEALPKEAATFEVRVFKGEHDDFQSRGTHYRSSVKGTIARLGIGDIDDTTARHEAGHMLGLGDEYPEPQAAPEAIHSTLVEREFGYKVIRSKIDPGSIMAKGTRIMQEHGVVFLEALRSITKIDEWFIPAPVKLKPDP
jgi:hypothetical protein